MKGNKPALKKTMGTLDVFCLCSGAMISSGLFILPSIAFGHAGPAVLLSYAIASLLMIPAMLAKAEMSTAMPKSGGSCYFISRSLGPLAGTFSGLTNWFSLALKSAFALIGIGMLATPFFPDITPFQIKLVAAAAVMVFTILNMKGVEESGKFQLVFVMLLVGLLVAYILVTLPQANQENFTPFVSSGWSSVISTSALVFISYGGLTKVASVAEEIRNPGKSIPRGMLISFSVVSLLYILSVTATIGMLSPSQLASSPLPISEGARLAVGPIGFVLMAVAAMAAFFTTANAGIMAASRNPMAMAEDHYIPSIFARVNQRTGTPIVSILTTSGFMIAVILFLDTEQLVEAASTMMLVLFTLDCVSLLLLRWSKISTYRPLFRCPLVPALPIIGIVSYIGLIIGMGVIPLLITIAFLVFSVVLYFCFSRYRAQKDSALIHLAHRISGRELESPSLDEELREVLLIRDEVEEDRFDLLIREAPFSDLPEGLAVQTLYEYIAEDVAKRFSLDKATVFEQLQEQEKSYTSSIGGSLAIPHLVLPGEDTFLISVYRSKEGIEFPATQDPVKIVFFLAGTKDQRHFHLQALMSIAQIVQDETFTHDWMRVRSARELRHLVLLAERIRHTAV